MVGNIGSRARVHRRPETSVDVVIKLSSCIDIGEKTLRMAGNQKTVPPACSTIQKLFNKLVPILKAIREAGAIPNSEAVHARMGVMQECVENGCILVQEMCSMRRIVYYFRAPMISNSLQELCTNLSKTLSEIAALLLNPNTSEIRSLMQNINDLSRQFAKGKFPIQAEVERFFFDWRKIVTRLYNKHIDPETARANLRMSFEDNLGQPLQPEDERDIAQQVHRDLHSVRTQKNEMEEHYLRSIINLLTHQAMKPEFQCPISLDIMSDPVALVSTGVVYDKNSIIEYLSYGYNKCPVTQQTLKTKEFIEIPLLKSLISSWKQEFKINTEDAEGSSRSETCSQTQSLERQSTQRPRAGSQSSVAMSQVSFDTTLGVHHKIPDETVLLDTNSTGLSLSDFEVIRPTLDIDEQSEYPEEIGNMEDLQQMVMDDNLDGLKRMLETGRDLSCVDDAGRSLLHFAAEHNSKGCLKFLLQLQLSINQPTKEYFETPLFVAANSGKSFAVDLLLKHGADITIVTKGGWNPIHISAHRGYCDCLQYCLESARRKGLRSAPTVNGWSTLHHAAYSGCLETMKHAIFYEPGIAAMNQTCREGFTPLHIAASRGTPEVVGALLEAGAHVNAQCNGGWSALLFAQEENAVGIGKVLLKYGANPNLCTKKEGLTPLHRAVMLENIHFIDLLLQCRDIDVTLRTKTAQRTAADYAKRQGNNNTYKRIQTCGKRPGIGGRIAAILKNN